METPETLTPRQKYYLAHKDEPEFVEKARQSRREWYHRNRDREAKKALERYYAKKEAMATTG